MSTPVDRPLSETNQLAWNGVGWASSGSGTPPAGGGYAGNSDQGGYGRSPDTGRPGSYGAGAPQHGGGTPYGPAGYQYGGPPVRRSPLPWIVGGGAALIALVIVLIFALGGGSSSTLAGTFNCSAPGVSQTGTITFSGNNYTIEQGTGGTFTHSGSTVTFTGGDLNGVTANFDSSKSVLSGTFNGTTITCKK